MTDAMCSVCGRPMTGSGYGCHACRDSLATLLADVGWLADELRTTELRQSRTGGQRAGSRSTSRPLPWDDRAAKALVHLAGTVRRWALRVRPEDERLPVPLGHVAAWLANRLDVLAALEEFPAAFDELDQAVKRARRAVDRPADRWYAGPCGAEIDAEKCPAELYARPGAATITCPTCRAVWDVQARRRWLLDAAEDQLAHASLIARAVTALGTPVTPERLRQWAHRCRLVAHGVDFRGRPTYRVGDVIDLLTEEAQVEAKREQRGRRSA